MESAKAAGRLGALYGMALEGNKKYLARALDQLILDLDKCTEGGPVTITFHPDQLEYLVNGLKSCRDECQSGKRNPFNNVSGKYDEWGYPEGHAEKMVLAYEAVERLKAKNPSYSNEQAILAAPEWLLVQRQIKMPADTVHKYYYQYKKSQTKS
ncbi:MAG: hypothetical protein V7725_04435 [Porticoccus sp.]